MARIRQGKEKKAADAKKRDVKPAPAASTSAPEDPELVQDVSSFLKKLKSGGDVDTEEPMKPAKPKSKPQPKKEKAKAKDAPESSKGKQDDKPVKDAKSNKKKESKKQTEAKKQTESKKPKPASAPVSAPAPVPEPAPAVELPKKISLNGKTTFVLQPLPQWYSLELSAIPSSPLVSAGELGHLSTHAASLHARDIESFQVSSSSQTSEASFLSKIIQSGTLSDRLSALTLLVQSGPVHNIKALEILKTMAERGKGKGGRDESLKALRCIVDWWVGGGAPNRKLKYFRDRPLKHADVTDQHLLMWYFEDWLKKYFFSILQILETLSLDPLTYVRTQAMNLLFILLRDKPEQEQNLLRLLVNKLGDIDKALCSRASHHLLQLLQTHPSMKSVIVTEIVSFVLRPSMSAAATSAPPTTPTEVSNRRIRFEDAPKPKPQEKEKEKKFGNAHVRYYATITFNQIVLTSEDREVSLKLIDLYFEIFKEILGEGGGEGGPDGGQEVDGDEEEVKKDLKGRVMERKHGKKGKGKEKDKEIRGAAGFTEVEDEHSKLISAILTGVNRALPFAKVDADDTRLSKHIDTLFLITHKSTFNISLQALVLIQQISASLSAQPSTSSTISKSIVDRFYRTLYESLHDVRLATSSKQAMYLNLLFKSVKADVNAERVKAMVRRFVQLLVSGGSGASEFVVGGLFLLGELFGTTPGLREMISKPSPSDAGAIEGETYDARKRDPQYAHASASPLWELTPLLYHYHPTISLLARQLLSSQPLSASADLSLNTLSHFLDRFVYKNAKKTVSAKGVSAMQPAAGGLDGTGVRLLKGDSSAGREGMRVNEEAWAKRRVEEVPVDEVFFHKFFARKNERGQKKGGKEQDEEDEGESGDEVDEGDGDAGSEDESDGSEGEEMDLTGDEADADAEAVAAEDSDSDEEEDEIWKVMKASMPKAGDDDDDLLDDSDADIDDDDEMPSDMDSEGGMSLAEDSEDDDLVAFGDDGLIEFDGSGSDEDLDAEVGGAGADEEWGGIGGGGGDGPNDGGASGKRKRDEKEERKANKKKRRDMPTFASYEDYAKMIEDGPEDDI